MLKILKKLFYFLSIVLLYFIVKEFLQLYNYTYGIHPFLAYFSLIVFLGILIYFVAIPILQILKMPRNYAPAKDLNEKQKVLEYRINNFKKNKFLKEKNISVEEMEISEENYIKTIAFIDDEAHRLRKAYVNRLFYSTAVSQNGFIDAVLILSASVNLVKNIFILYHGRVSNRDLWEIAKRVYMNVAIGGSESVAYATEEIYSKLATESMRSIPFADKILGSVTDGFVNAMLLTRVSLITENYCKKLYISSDKELYPTISAVHQTTKHLVSEAMDRLKKMIFIESAKKGSDMITKGLNSIFDPVKDFVGEKFGWK